MTVAFNICKDAKRTTFKLMRYVTDTVTHFLIVLQFSPATSFVLISLTPPPHPSPFFPFCHIYFVASPCTVDGTWEP